MPDLLIELFSEEIPARMQARAREDLKKLVTDGLVEAGLTYASAGAFSTPRRLCLTIEGLSAESPALREERKGPRTDAPAPAIEGFLRSTGLTLEQLAVRDDKKAQVYFAVIEKPGRKAPEIIAEVLEKTIRTFPWPKSMRWGSGNLRWVRPLHSILCILTTEAGAEVVDLNVEGIVAGNTTQGHRFLAPGRFGVQSFDDYVAKLRAAKVILDQAERAEIIRNYASQTAFAQGLEVVEDAGLLTEIAGLVEWPVPLMGPIAEEFLGLPPEVLQTSMKEHQKFFSIRNPATGRIEKFLTVANTETADNGATILAGNGKVLAARLSDARFFWDNDLRVAKEGMTLWAEGLKAVTFHNKLGSQSARIARIAALAAELAPVTGADVTEATRAAELAKLDLRSAMVGEFPELQGLMGRYYALAAGESAAVADAARDHYSPLGPTDTVPTAPVSVAVALADKLDTLTGFWAIDEKPTGSKDPFALRRAALGVIRLILTNDLRLNLQEKLQKIISSEYKLVAEQIGAVEQERISKAEADMADPQYRPTIVGGALMAIGATTREEYALAIAEEKASLGEKLAYRASVIARLDNAATDLLGFIHDRLKVFLKDEGIRHDVIDACLAMPGNDDLTLLVKRARALSAMLATEDGTNLIQGFKRANNILTQAEAKDGVEYSFGPDIKFAEGDEEKALFAALDQAEAAITPAMASEDFASAMAAMAALRAPIDAFFTAVQVNSDNQLVRRNRLNLLHRIRAICGQVADLARIDG
ncbi:glycine--tRNA ligase subunit beta [Falsigemmobacter intermedius]|uniref:Glycine--tRNA ligase beta subunit n=1 Tax=Falsigemmobacter intermedius TaxID=1553448 RepID=A0A3S4XWL0_9RHOB|nr:glycine--tRNA ligase subunit beta [Falsigemmobacter intermedius]RWY43223.1 glycine--tRNA ligase subunit beta [Falsigemmobacter intermedius]